MSHRSGHHSEYQPHHHPQDHGRSPQRRPAQGPAAAPSPASYVITNYSMNHPMGQRPDTEATYTTPAGTFKITDKEVKDGMLINGQPYPNLTAGSGTGRLTITIDEKGAITVDDPTAKDEPKAETPRKE